MKSQFESGKNRSKHSQLRKSNISEDLIIKVTSPGNV
jgi:hypothetical protein